MNNFKRYILLFTLVALAPSANAKNINPTTDALKNFKSDIVKSTPGNDSSIVFLQSFFKWYKTKVDYLNHHIFTVNMDLKNNTPYRINFKEAEKYLIVLKMSGFFSDNYINDYRDYFKKIDLTLQKTKQNDGTVDGLDYDPIVHSQEPNAILENLNNIKLTVIKSMPDEITIKMSTPFDRDVYSLYHLKKANSKYLIVKIDFLIGGKIQN